MFVETALPVELSMKAPAFPCPSSIVSCAEKGGPTVTPAILSTKYSMFGFELLYPSILTT